jgi:SpoVK/Ycf46/Vps4 family AAA+-type ATPase
MNNVKDLLLILQSHTPLVVIESDEERRVLAMIREVAKQFGRPAYSWTVTEGLKKQDMSIILRGTPGKMAKPEDVLNEILKENTPGIYVLCDFHHYFQESPHVVRLMKEIAIGYDYLGHTLILLSHSIDLPDELKPFGAGFEMSMPDSKKVEKIVRNECKRWALENKQFDFKVDEKILKQITRNLRGITDHDVRRLARKAIYDDGVLSESDLPEINKAKFELLDMGGVLCFEYDTSNFSDVGGLKKLKHWLAVRKKAFLVSGQNTGLDTPKGIMLLGVQGGGKSLAARAVAGVWGVPLLRLDMGTLYNKFFGETERNIRKTLKMADTMAPCVLWMDEIEKGIATGDYDSGTSKRVLGTLLTWMSERKTSVFIVATSNDISALPPELLRKGRLDEIFFVDLPDQTIRKDIFRIHFVKRGLNPEQFDIDSLAKATSGFSGAEIEQSVVAGLYNASAYRKPLSSEHLLKEITGTSPLSVVMSDKMTALRNWAKNRAVFAD